MNRWLDSDAPRGDRYDDRWRQLEASGASIHGEADLVASYAPRSVLDAGCGTGRVAVELHRRGMEVCGLDLDPAMLAAARDKAPELDWIQGDLADPVLDLGRRFEIVVAAGNVMIFVSPGTERSVLATCRRHLEPNGLLVTGFQLRPGGLQLEQYDDAAVALGLVLEDRWATWDRRPLAHPADYAVSVHRAVG